jgi:hypothetical protein
MKTDTATTLRAFVIELIVYGILVTGYFFLVLHYLSGWLQDLHPHHVKLYALVAVALIIGQAVLLESVTTSVLVARAAKTNGAARPGFWAALKRIFVSQSTGEES